MSIAAGGARVCQGIVPLRLLFPNGVGEAKATAAKGNNFFWPFPRPGGVFLRRHRRGRGIQSKAGKPLSLATGLLHGCIAGCLVCCLLVDESAHRLRRRTASCVGSGSGEHGCVPGRCSSMDLFYCGSNQSVGAMVFPLVRVVPFAPVSGSRFGVDGGERRRVRAASTEESKDLTESFSFSRVFFVMVGQLSSLSRRCWYLILCVRHVIRYCRYCFKKNVIVAVYTSVDV